MGMAYILLYIRRVDGTERRWLITARTCAQPSWLQMRRSRRVVTAHIVHFRIKWNPEVAFHHLDLESFLSILILYGPWAKFILGTALGRYVWT